MAKKLPLFCIISINGKVLDCSHNQNCEKLHKKYCEYEDIKVFMSVFEVVIQQAEKLNAPERVINKLILLGEQCGVVV